MARILICTQREDLLDDLRPLHKKEHQMVFVPDMTGVIRSLLLARFDAAVLDLDDATPEDIQALPIIGRLDSQLPAIAVCDHLSLELEAAIREAGTFTQLLRPLAPHELERHLITALRWRAAEPAASSRQQETKSTKAIAP